MSSNNTVTFKRRKLDGISSPALSKPFKSPLRKPVDTETSHITKNTTTTSASTATTATTTTPSTISEISNIAQPSGPITPRPRKYPNPYLLTKTPTHSPPLQSSSSSPAATACITTLQKQHTSLQSRLLSLHQELDTVSQALRIEEKGTDTELQELVVKWRDASRAAAEELFVAAREKVDRMGGVGVWNERVRNDRLRRLEGNEAFNSNADGPAGDGENEEVEQEGESKDDEADMEEHEAFTIDLMLKHMNVDLDVIGYDKENQRWAD